ncbi:SusD/RagB family nutrient-binding outer membrane lipoprotein [Spirosoma sp. BT702]|uniref:SusD/RagB family nutrient-binding outer membrane lipoprotein n=1 Tax=Spirosoma profusum TaxID=2771354 RepID=A0A926Y3T6_9BACT|nr:SusD/RagB family nutrient-binding outer membrane lipoprotein [Spirosoma profusum]MBD2702245.1 SusD/RagB family nutrient-binding outer membrane lipoprotein [Spirosoma profusum]
MKAFQSILLGGLLVSTVACTKFEELNVNPNSALFPNTASLMTGAERTVGTINSQVGPGGFNIAPALYVQQFSDVTYIEDSRYKTINFSFNGLYAGPLVNLQAVIDQNTNEATRAGAAQYGSNANQIAIARILRAYIYQFITDRWGDVPYTQALKGDQNFSPAFDKQQDIYNDLFKEWKEAAAQFDGGKAVAGDIILSSNAARWKKLAASFRLIAALRLSKVDPAKGKTEFNAALADGVLASNADNVQYKFQADVNNENPLYANYVRNNRKDFAVSSTFVDYLKKLGDPRLPIYADKNLKGDYVGAPYAVFPAPGKAQDYSLAGQAISAQTAPANIMTYAQVLFAQAEAAKLGWTTGNAKTLYESAIKASMQQWLGAAYTDAAFNTYIAQPDVAYTDANANAVIGNQRWIALFNQGTEAWNEWRRTGYPVLKPAASPLNGGTDIPRRLAYPTTVTTLNTKNYNEVVTRQGKDDQYTRVWWDKQ